MRSLHTEPREQPPLSAARESTCSKEDLSSLTHSGLTLRPHGLQHVGLPCPSPTPRACSNLVMPTSQRCHPTISSSVVPFSCLQSFPASGSFPMSQFFTSGDQTSAFKKLFLVFKTFKEEIQNFKFKKNISGNDECYEES